MSKVWNVFSANKKKKKGHVQCDFRPAKSPCASGILPVFIEFSRSSVVSFPSGIDCWVSWNNLWLKSCFSHFWRSILLTYLDCPQSACTFPIARDVVKGSRWIRLYWDSFNGFIESLNLPTPWFDYCKTWGILFW